MKLIYLIFAALLLIPLGISAQVNNPYSYNLLDLTTTSSTNVSNETANNSLFLIGIPGEDFVTYTGNDQNLLMDLFNITATFFKGSGKFLTDIIIGNIFNQDLNTTSNVTFNNVNVTEEIFLNDYNLSLGMANSMSSGLIDGGIISINADPALFDVSATTAWFVNNSNTINPNLQYITCPAFTGVSITNLLTSDRSDVALNRDCSLSQKATPFTNSQTRSKIVLGRIVHPNHVSITANVQLQHYGLSVYNQYLDLSHGIGNINTNGNVYSASGPNLSIQHTSGRIFRIGANYVNDRDNPNEVSLDAVNPIGFFYRFQDGSGGFSQQAAQTTLNVSFYDDGSGTLASVGNNKYTVQRVFLFSAGQTVIQYGQAVYNKLSEATAAISTEDFNTDPNLEEDAVLRGWIVVKGSATDLTDSTEATIINAGKFGSLGGGTGTSAAQEVDLQNAYDNSLEPEIVLDSTHNGLTIQDAASPLNKSLFEILNSTGTGSFFNVSSNGTFIDNLIVTNLVSCDTINTTANGTFVCGIDSSGGNPFDQVLNTTSNVTFNNQTITNDLTVGSHIGTSTLNVSGNTNLDGRLFANRVDDDDVSLDNDNTQGAWHWSRYKNGNGGLNMFFKKAQGTPSTPLYIENNNNILNLQGQAWDENTGAFRTVGNIRLKAGGDHTSTNFASLFLVQLTKSGDTSVSSALQIDEDLMMTTYGGRTKSRVLYFDNTSLTELEEIVFVSAFQRNVTISLPLSSISGGRVYTIVKVADDSNIVTIHAINSQTINGQEDYILDRQYQGVTIMSDGSIAWNILSSNTPVGNITTFEVLNATGLNVSGRTTFRGTVHNIVDGVKTYFGASDDISLEFNGTDFIENVEVGSIIKRITGYIKTVIEGDLEVTGTITGDLEMFPFMVHQPLGNLTNLTNTTEIVNCGTPIINSSNYNSTTTAITISESGIYGISYTLGIIRSSGFGGPRTRIETVMQYSNGTNVTGSKASAHYEDFGTELGGTGLGTSFLFNNSGEKTLSLLASAGEGTQGIDATVDDCQISMVRYGK